MPHPPLTYKWRHGREEIIWVLVQIVKVELNETAIISSVRAYGSIKNALSD